MEKKKSIEKTQYFLIALSEQAYFPSTQRKPQLSGSFLTLISSALKSTLVLLLKAQADSNRKTIKGTKNFYSTEQLIYKELRIKEGLKIISSPTPHHTIKSKFLRNLFWSKELICLLSIYPKLQIFPCISHTTNLSATDKDRPSLFQWSTHPLHLDRTILNISDESHSLGTGTQERKVHLQIL